MRIVANICGKVMWVSITIEREMIREQSGGGILGRYGFVGNRTNVLFNRFIDRRPGLESSEQTTSRRRMSSGSVCLSTSDK